MSKTKLLSLSLLVLSAGLGSAWLFGASRTTRAASLDKSADKSAPAPRPVANGGALTFTKDVAPIVWANCVTCHRPGEVAPFPLTSFKDVKKHLSQITDVTESRYMPPWKPEAGHGDFVGARVLTDGQLRTLQDWARQGAPEGDPSLLPPLPKFVTAGAAAEETWELGEPDLVVKMPKPFTVRAEGRDEFRSFVIPLDEKTLPEDKYVRAVDFRPGNRKVVHHALIFTDGSGQARALDGQDGKPGWGRGPGGLGFTPNGSLGGWSPGVTPRPLPDDVGRALRKGSDIVLQMHFHPSGKPEEEQSTLALYFTKKPPRNVTVSFPKASRPLNIPPGEKNYVVDDGFTVPTDVWLIGIFPHAHLLCREVKIDATLPNGTQVPLIWIKDWDWNWQDMYQYKQAVHVPGGTRVSLHYVYDNSADNPHNPSSPPKRVTWGEQTSDEMAITFFQIEIDRELAALFGNGAFGGRGRGAGGGAFRRPASQGS